MGGVAGHMDHLYDNPNLTFREMKEIMDKASNGELSYQEKVDGQNLFLSYSIPEGKAKGARNKGNLKAGGLDATELAQKFAGRGGLEQAFNGGFSAFEKAVEALSDEEKERIFGPDTNIWYNAEVMDPGSMNVIKYDDKTLKIHDVGHFVFDRETGEKQSIPAGTLESLDQAYDRMQQRLHGHDFNIARKAIIEIDKLEDEEALNVAKTRIDTELSSEGLSENSTVNDYIFERLKNGIDTEMSDEFKNNLVKYLLKMPGNVGKNALKKGLSRQDVNELNSIVSNKRMLLRQAIEPIEMIVHDFTVSLLKGIKSVFISDNDTEVSRLREELSKAVKALTNAGSENPQAMEIMQFHLNKIKDFSQITTPVEAVVFDYNGHTYKFAGNFAPLNQILGMFKYPKSGETLTTESVDFESEVLTDKKGKRVALLPGGFKPPHAGHYELSKFLASAPDIDEVLIIIGKNPRSSEYDPSTIITAAQSKRLWDIYTKGDENIKVTIQKGKTPVSDVYDLIADKNSFSEGDTVILGKSDKDEGDKRFARAQSYAERNNPGVNVEEKVMPAFGGKNMGGTYLRNLIASDKKEQFLSKLPTNLNNEDKENVWNIVSPQMREDLNNIIDTTISEISAMSVGSVEGSPFSQKKKEVYNPWKKRNTKKPTVKRGKRQRRR